NAEQDLFLDPAQTQIPLGVDDLLQGFPASGLDEEIGVEKGAPGQLGQNYPHRALAGAWHADQDNVGCCPHHKKLPSASFIEELALMRLLQPVSGLLSSASAPCPLSYQDIKRNLQLQ